MGERCGESLEEVSARLTRVQRQNTGKISKYIKLANSFPTPDMAKVIPQNKKGAAQIEHFDVPADPLRTLRAMFSDPMHFIPAGKYARLTVDGQLMMTDTLFERATAHPFLKRACGDVLITGLGIGMVLAPLGSWKKIKSVTVVENSQDVIDLVEPYVSFSKLKVVCADAFDWHPGKRRFDVVWHDIWPTISEDSLPEIEKLKRRYGQWLKKGGWQGAWAHEKIKEVQRKRRDEETVRVGRYEWELEKVR